MTEKMFQFNGRGLMTRLPWPLSSWGLVTIAGGVFGSVVGLLRRARSLSRSENLAELAESNGLQYCPNARMEGLAAPAFTVFQGSKKVENIIQGNVDGVPLAAFDCREIIQGSESSQTIERTVVLLPGEGLPDFFVGPRDFGARLFEAIGLSGIRFDPAAAETADDVQAVERFTRLFHLATVAPLAIKKPTDDAPQTPQEETNEQALRKLFTPRVLGALGRYAGWAMQAKEGGLAIWQGRRTLPAYAWPDLWQNALALRQLILTGARGEPGSTSVLPAEPSTVRSHRFRRVRFAFVGGVLGFLTGMVIGFFGFAALAFGRAPLQPPPQPIATVALFIPAILGCALLGGLVGCALGAAVERLTRGSSSA
jgi:hypothetical protein